MLFKILIVQLLTGLLMTTVSSAQSAEVTNHHQPIDEIMVIVNDDVITRHELDTRMATVVGQLKKQGTPLPEAAVLNKQILERMIGDLLQQQFAVQSSMQK